MPANPACLRDLVMALLSIAFAGSVGLNAEDRALLVEPAASSKWAILIGVDDYINAADLRFCGNDMEALKAQLIATGFREDHIILMHDEARERRYRPFKSNIETELNLLLGRLDAKGETLVERGIIEKGDMIVIAFSGHGIHPDGGSQSYFCPADTEVDRPTTMIALEKLYRQLELCPAEIKLLVVDACRNDPRPEGEKSMRATDETREFAKTLQNPPSGILVLSSCAPGQVSWEDGQIKHGVFINYILQGLRGAADAEEGNRNHKVSLLELYKYAYNNTKAYVLRNRRKIQTPALRGEITGDFEFGATQDKDFAMGMHYYLGNQGPIDWEKSYTLFRQAAGRGDPRAQALVGVHHGKGIGGLRVDRFEACHWCSLAKDKLTDLANAGDPLAQTLLGEMHENGWGVTEAHFTATMWYQRAAAQGFAEAQVRLGIMIGESKGVLWASQNGAVQWFRLAAKQGHAEGQAHLAEMYECGRGVKEDPAEAAKWYRLAAGQGHPSAQNSLGIALDNGDGVSEDNYGAVKWFSKAADRGYIPALYNLGIMYEKGQGVAPDAVKAHEWYMKAADLGYAHAQFKVAFYFDDGIGVEKDDAKAREWYRKAAEQGHPTAQNNLGVLFSTGDGGEKNVSKAVAWYRKAAEQGNAVAQYHLAESYATGRGCKQSDSNAFDWCLKSAELGYWRAQFRLGVMYEEGVGVSTDPDEANKWYRRAMDGAEGETLHDIEERLKRLES